MKAFKIILFLWLGLFMATAMVAQRHVILSHGFGGGSDTWGVYKPTLGQMLTTVTNERVKIVNYNSHRGVDSARLEVEPLVANNNQNIAVVHSMGGLVWRELDRQHPGQKAGGIITLGTPNRGGAMVNAMRNGSVQAEFQDGCNKIGGAIGSGSLALSATNVVGNVVNSVTRPLFGNTLGNATNAVVGVSGSVLDVFKGFLCDKFITIVNKELPVVKAPLSARDMAVGSDIVNNLNASNTPTPKIGLFGVEESPVHIRLMGSYQNTPSLQPLGVENTDEAMVETFNNLNDVVNAGEAILIAATISYSAYTLWNWDALYPAIVCAWASYEWGQLYRWLAQSESKWHALIGAGGFFTETVNQRVFTCNDALDNAFDAFESGQINRGQLHLIRMRLNADPNCYGMMPLPVHIPINNQSDGLFNAGTARIPTDPNSSSHVINLEVKKANHQELLNHSNMTIRFIDIFAGRTAADLFFITP